MNIRHPVKRQKPLKIWVPCLPPGLNGSKGLIRMHYRTRKKTLDSWVLMILAATPGRKLFPGPLKLTMTRKYAKLPLDLDNAAASAKIPMDALRHVGILSEDDPTVVSSFEVKQEKVAHLKDQGVLIRLEVDL